MAQKEFSETKLTNILKQTAEWLADFQASPQQEALGKSVAESEEMILAFTKQAYEQQLRAPKEWTGASVAELFETGTFDGATLAAYVTFLGEANQIKNAATLLKKIPTEQGATKEQPKKTAPAKKTTQTSAYTEEEIERFNLFPMGNFAFQSPVQAAQEAVTEQAEAKVQDFSQVGRNEPCPCGSGKKFKKCHGRAS